MNENIKKRLLEALKSFLEGEKGDEAVLNLSDLAHLSDGVFKDRFVHFSSCRTLLGSEKELENFKRRDWSQVYIRLYKIC